MKSLDGEFLARARRLAGSDAAAIHLSEHGQLWWEGAAIGRLTRGSKPYEPVVSLFADENLRSETRARIQARLDAWIADLIAARLEPLLALRRAADAKPGTPQALPGEARGLAHQLCESFGALDRGTATLPPDERIARRALRPFGVVFGRRAIYMPKLLKPDAAQRLALLWGVWQRLEKLPSPPQAGFTSFERDAAMPDGFLAAAGFRQFGPRAIRLDMVERLEDSLAAAAQEGSGADAVMPRLMSLLGCDRPALETVLDALGWQRIEVAPKGETGAAATVWRRSRPVSGGGKPERKKPPRPQPDRPSPFSGLARLIAAD